MTISRSAHPTLGTLISTLLLCLSALFTTSSLGAVPTVQTLSATTSPATSSATLNARITANGGSSILERRFSWGTTAACSDGWTNNVSVNGNDFSYNLQELAPGTYYYQAWAKNSTGWGSSTAGSFYLAPAPVPTVQTLAASSITTTTATLNGNVNPNGSATTAYFQYGTTTSYGNATGPGNCGSGTTTLGAMSALTGLTPDTLYHFRIVASNPGGSANGDDLTFRTSSLGAVPTVQTLSATTSPATSSATLNARITANGGSSILERRFSWGTTAACSDGWTNNVSVNGNDFSYNLQELAPGTYYYQAWAKNSTGWGSSTAGSFYLAPAPTIQTLAATDVTATSATLNGSYDTHGLAGTIYFEYGLTTSYGSSTTAGDMGPPPSTFSSLLTGLSPNTLYHFRVVATIAGGSTYAGDLTFRTLGPTIRVAPLQITVDCGSQGPGPSVASSPAFAATPSPSAEPSLRPREALTKPAKSALGDRSQRHVIVVKFKDGLNIHAQDGSLADGGTGDLSTAAALLTSLQGTRWEPVHKLPPQKLHELRRRAQIRLGKSIADLALQFYAFLPPAISETSAIDDLNALEIVELAQPVPLPASPPTPPDFQPNQGYLASPADGIGATTAWATYNTRGAGIKIADIELAYNQTHQDLHVTVVGTSLAGDDGNHGTATLGVLGALNNGWGTTGISSDSSLYFSGTWNGKVNNIPGAISTALELGQLGPGDVILIEQQTYGPRYVPANYPSQFGMLPVEWDPNTYATIQTAIGNGVVVVEAAGNGFQNLDDSIYSTTGNNGHRPFLPQNDSGAIMVGAGAAPSGSATPRSRLAFSNYGTTVDLQGWGELVWTTGGYGWAAYSSEGADLYYTGQFNGTSSASAIVAGTSALLQSAYKTKTGAALSPEDVKQILRGTGSAQQGNASENIGPLPNVAAAIADILPTSAAGSFRVFNEGRTSLAVNSLSLDQPGAWISWHPQAPFTVPPQSFRTVTVFVNCAQTPPGQTIRQIVVHSSDAAYDPYPGGVYVTATGVAPAIAVTPANQDFGPTQVGTTADRTFAVQNIGGGSLSGSASVAAPFSIVSGSPYTLAANQTASVVVRYSPPAGTAGPDSQTVYFTGGAGMSRPVSGTSFLPAVDTPTITPPGGTFQGWVRVTLSETTAGANVHYSVDGNDPAADSPLYAGPFNVTATSLLKAKGFLTGYDPSGVAQANFTITPIPAPQFTATTLPGGTIHFTVNSLQGAACVIQISDDLTNWSPFSTSTVPASGTVEVDDTNMASHPRRFYRALIHSP